MIISRPRLAFKAAAPEPEPAKRLAPFSLRLTQDERAELEAKADGMPLGTYIKSRLFQSGKGARTRMRQTDRKALAAVLGAIGQSRIPQNLHQIAKAANLGVLPVTQGLEAELHATCAELKDLRTLILTALDLQEPG